MSDQDAAQTEKEMREHERQARERNPDERSADDTKDAGISSMADGVTGDKEDPDDMAPPGTAGRMSGGG